jgi:hypothetical protein
MSLYRREGCCAAAILLGSLVVGFAQTPAFPGAEGFGAYATVGAVKPVVSPLTPPSFSGISMAGGSVILSGSGGTPDADYCVFSATNLATLLTNWARLVTNQFDSNGSFAWTNTPAPGTPEQFYRLASP